MTRGWAVRVPAALVLALAMGCGPGDTSTGVSSSTSTSPTGDGTVGPGAEESEQAGDPATEQPGATEGPATGNVDAVAVELPGLPVGGQVVLASTTLQCVDTGWSAGPELPLWARVTLTGIAFDPAGDFSLSATPCPGTAPSCLDADFALTADGPRCVVAVAWAGSTPAHDPRMSVTAGRVSCPPGLRAECTAFQAAVAANGPRSIALEPEPFESDLPPPGPATGTTPQTGVPQTGVPQTGVPQTGVPQTGVPESEGATTGDPESGVTESSGPESGGTATGGTAGTDPGGG